MQPKVSVLIPTYNSALYLDEAIQSVLSQTLTDFELIIVDNASTDNTQLLIEKYLSDHRVSYYRNEENIGMAGNWNKCLELANGTYIKFLMSDDKFHPELLEKFVAVMDKYPDVSIVASYRGLFSGNEEPQVFKTPVAGLQERDKIISDTLNTWNWIGEPTTVMFRKRNLYLGGFNPSFKYYLDWDMWLRHLTVGDCYFIPEVLSFFRIHNGQATSQLKQNYSLFFEEYQFYKYLDNNKPYGINRIGFDPRVHLKEKAWKLFKIGLKLIIKGKVRDRKVIFKAIRTGSYHSLSSRSHWHLFNFKNWFHKVPV